MINKIKPSRSEKIIFIFILTLATFTITSYFLLKNKCLFIEDFNPKNLVFDNPENIAVLNIDCGNVIIELYPDLSPNSVERFKTLIKSKAYDDVAFHRVIKDKLVQAGDIEFGKRNNIDYGKIGTGKSGLGTLNSEVDKDFNYDAGSVALARSQKYNTEDSQFFITLQDEPLYEGEYTPIGKVLYGLETLRTIKYLDKSVYVLRPDFINSLRMLID
ncbi:cyclophilin-like peptidyl-prolyl cis-trans isomerase family protein [alpha proteobacterium HIMB5]|nr:cyclophilin-like peptidyl-prolyl cis-trans isomerase family protein [alpha proteobacterium HIMB5]